MSKCIRRIMKPTEESYIKCDKCGKEITETEAEMSRVPLLWFWSKTICEK